MGLEITSSFLSMYFLGGFSLSFCIQSLVVLLFLLYIIIFIQDLFYTTLHAKEELATSYEILIRRIEETLFKISIDKKINFISKPFLGIIERHYLKKSISDFEFFDENLLNQVLLDEKSTSWDWRDDKSNTLYRFQASIINKLDGQRIILVICLDITAPSLIKENELKIIKAEASLKSKVEFIASISHEIRNPLQAVNFSSENLLSTTLTNQQQEIVNDIMISNRLVSNILGDILDMSKIEAGKMVIQKSLMNLLEVCEVCIELNYFEAQKKNLNLFLTIDFDLPQNIYSDKSRISQIINNFISNSIKYSNSGSIYLSCTKVTKNGQKFVKFRVDDQGIGITPEDCKRIYNPFEQFHNGTKGYGLGLSICKKLTDLLQGDIYFESKVGVGSSFSVEIPIKSPSEEIVYSSSKLCDSYDSIIIFHKEEKYLKYLCNIFHHKDVKYFKGLTEFHSELNFKESIVFIDEHLIHNTFEAKKIYILGEKKMENAENIKLPLKISKVKSYFQPEERPTAHEKAVSLLKEKKILIVEDNPVIHKSLIQMLKNYGIRTIESAFNGVEGVEKCKKNFYDFILMDIQMPKMNGLESTAEIRKIQDNLLKKSIIICCTGNAMQFTDVSKKEFQMDQFLAKPVTKRVLIEHLEAFSVKQINELF